MHGTADNGVVASGGGYIRFGDNAQICWGRTSQITVNSGSTVTYTVSYAASFSSSPSVSLVIGENNNNDNYLKLVLHTSSVTTTNFILYFKNSSSGQMAPIAQWIAIGRWK